MATIWFDNGNIAQIEPHMDREMFVQGPPGTRAISFDETTNPTLVGEIRDAPERFTLADDGTLLCAGVAVRINPDGPIRADLVHLLGSVIAKLAPCAEPLSNADIVCVFRLLLAKLRAGRL